MTFELTLRLFAAFACGVAIGLERQIRQRTAGLRTVTLLASGACLFVTLGVLTGNGTSGITQIAAYVVSGVGFLGGGVIMRDGLNVRGLNTAATLWCTAAIGVLFLWIMPDNQLNAKFLTEKERLMAVERIRINQQGVGNKHFKFYQFKEAMTDPMVWAFVFYSLVSNQDSRLR